MATRKIDNIGDFTFGQGAGNYNKNNDAEISQNVVTRIRSFKFDYFLDIQANIDWLNILGVKNNETLIINEVRKVIQQTTGVQRVNNVQLLKNDKRNATIQINFDTIYNKNIQKEVGISNG
jgi:hypothetical protein